MNDSMTLFLVNRDCRGILVSYEPVERGVKPNTNLCKTLDQSIKCDDMVVVETDTRHGMTVGKVEDVDIEPDFKCFDVDDSFLVGYGLDFAGRYRNLPFVGELKASVIEASQARKEAAQES